jgi:hypothetical protein
MVRKSGYYSDGNRANLPSVVSPRSRNKLSEFAWLMLFLSKFKAENPIAAVTIIFQSSLRTRAFLPFNMSNLALNIKTDPFFPVCPTNGWIESVEILVFFLGPIVWCKVRIIKNRASGRDCIRVTGDYLLSTKDGRCP